MSRELLIEVIETKLIEHLLSFLRPLPEGFESLLIRFLPAYLHREDIGILTRLLW